MTQEEKDLLVGKMLERPDTLTDNEIDLILQDEELHETYDTALLLRAAAMPEKEYDLDKEWQAFAQRQRSSATALSVTPHASVGNSESEEKQVRLGVRLNRWAAMITLTVSICAVAATISYRMIVPAEPEKAEEVADEKTKKTAPSVKQEAAAPQEPEEIRLAENLTFENKTLAEIAKQITAVFGCKVVFAEKEVAELRLYLTLPKGSTVAKFVEIIDAYDALDASLKDQVITIKKQEAEQ